MTKTKTAAPLTHYAVRNIPWQHLRDQQTMDFLWPVVKKSVRQSKTMQIPSSPVADVAKLRYEEMIRDLQDQVSVMEEKRPAVPLDVLAEIFVIFRERLLNSTMLDHFIKSREKILCWDAHVTGANKVSLLLKHGGKVFLVVLSITYPKMFHMLGQSAADWSFEESLSMVVEMRRQKRNRVRVLMSIPIQPSRTGVRMPLRFQDLDATQWLGGSPGSSITSQASSSL